MRRRPRWVARCSVHVPLSKPPQPTPDTIGVAVPERKIGFEALEASAKLRKSSLDCLSAASFEAARSEQLRLPAEGPLKRRDGNSSKSTLNSLPRLGFSTHCTTLFAHSLELGKTSPLHWQGPRGTVQSFSSTFWFRLTALNRIGYLSSLVLRMVSRLPIEFSN